MIGKEVCCGIPLGLGLRIDLGLNGSTVITGVIIITVYSLDNNIIINRLRTFWIVISNVHNTIAITIPADAGSHTRSLLLNAVTPTRSSGISTCFIDGMPGTNITRSHSSPVFRDRSIALNICNLGVSKNG